jgi:hypothetical protein
MRKKNFVILLLGCFVRCLHAQQSTNAAGGNATGSGGSASYSLGQVAYHYYTGSGDSSSEGVQQPYEFFVTGINEYKNISLTMAVFPNPAQALVNLKIEGGEFQNLSFRLYDLSGRLLDVQSINEALTTVPIQNLSSGTYLLSVLDPEKILKTFKIIKNN